MRMKMVAGDSSSFWRLGGRFLRLTSKAPRASRLSIFEGGSFPNFKGRQKCNLLVNWGKRSLSSILLLMAFLVPGKSTPGDLKQRFADPPDSARPGVYWYFMDGNMDREGMTADLEAMKAAGIGNLVFLEVNVGVPRGPVEFLSNRWQELFAYAVHEAERLGIDITLGVGPGWTGSGGPWVKPEQSMQHLVAASVTVQGPSRFQAALPVPEPRKPYFDTLPQDLTERRAAFYEDVAVLAVPCIAGDQKIPDIDEKALYYRAPFSSVAGVKPYLPSHARYPEASDGSAIPLDKVIDITSRMSADGVLTWLVPAGRWTILRFGRRNNGANTRPAPIPGLGFECDKFDPSALDAHFQEYIGTLLKKVGTRKEGTGWTMIHMDSWEMGAQNWTASFREEFQRRRGYDPLPFYPAYTGRIIGGLEQSERFLWDVRETAQELVIENHARRLKELGRRYGLGLSIEPYDMNPTADLTLGAVADVPMCEFWSSGYGFDTSFSCIEASSIAHTLGRPLVAAEAFTADDTEAMKQYPGSMKNQGDWAFCAGINRFVFHTFAHQPLGEVRPGMTMGPYGVHWHRNQTWWPMAATYHRYVARCSFLLQQGTSVADILYLTPEGAPQVFQPPVSALAGTNPLPDRKGFNFDGCSPETLMAKAEVRDGCICFPGGSSYRLLVLPSVDTMTPSLLGKIASLARDGATVVGSPPLKSPSLSGYPECDRAVREGAEALWGSLVAPAAVTRRPFGKGRIVWGGQLRVETPDLYPNYDATATLLREAGTTEDFESQGSIRYTHRRTEDLDIYFLSNRTESAVKCPCAFRVPRGIPELWDPLTGFTRVLPESSRAGGRTVVSLNFEPYQSFFVVFHGNGGAADSPAVPGESHFDRLIPVSELHGPWAVRFDPEWGGPGEIAFERLEDWTARPERGVKYYSGIAKYRKSFDLNWDANGRSRLFLQLGKVNVMARVRLNGRDLGVLWCDPWRVDITDVVRAKGNRLEIEVANLWANRLIGDQEAPDNNVRVLQWPSGLLGGRSYETGRYTFSTHSYYKPDSPLQPSGLLGPVQLVTAKRTPPRH
jgi:hypothetical protein